MNDSLSEVLDAFIVFRIVYRIICVEHGSVANDTNTKRAMEKTRLSTRTNVCLSTIWRLQQHHSEVAHVNLIELSDVSDNCINSADTAPS